MPYNMNEAADCFNERNYMPATKWHYVTDSIRYRPYKHWGTGVHAGEMRRSIGGDGSGCLEIIRGRAMTTPPTVVEARHYVHEFKHIAVSAVLSYPRGLAYITHYFWEIYPDADGDIQRFDDEEAMELYVIELLNGTRTEESQRGVDRSAHPWYDSIVGRDESVGDMHRTLTERTRDPLSILSPTPAEMEPVSDSETMNVIHNSARTTINPGSWIQAYTYGGIINPARPFHFESDVRLEPVQSEVTQEEGEFEGS